MPKRDDDKRQALVKYRCLFAGGIARDCNQRQFLFLSSFNIFFSHCVAQEVSEAASSTMVVMLVKRCRNQFSESDIPAKAFTKVTHLELSALSVSMQQAITLSRKPLRMLDMSHATNLRLGDVDFKQDDKAKGFERLLLSNTSLKELPESIGELKSLLTLDVASNSLGRLPKLLPSTLEGLYASDNQLTSLPAMMQSMKRLEVLDVTNNHNLQSLPALDGASGRIRTVLASCCRLTKKNSVPESLFHESTNLQTLNLRSSHLRQLPANLGSAKLLTGFLSLGHNQLTSLPPSIGHATKLTGLSLDFNQDLQELPQSLSSLTNVETFDCTFCSSLKRCQNCLPKSVNRLVVTQSQHFDVVDALGDGHFENLEEMDASFTATTMRTRLPDSFKKMNRLKYLKLNACGGGPRLTELSADVLEALEGLQGLELQVCSV